MNHKWNVNKDVCLRCGIVRIRRSKRFLMSITDFPPYDHYLYEQYWEYNTIDGNLITKRPDCKTPNSSKKDERSVATDAK